LERLSVAPIANERYSGWFFDVSMASKPHEIVGLGATLAKFFPSREKDYRMVELSGIEPLTSSLRTTRSPN
jgi:hypothetical protein